MKSNKTETVSRDSSNGQFVVAGASRTSALNYYAGNPKARKATSKSFRKRMAVNKVVRQNYKSSKAS